VAQTASIVGAIIITTGAQAKGRPTYRQVVHEARVADAPAAVLGVHSPAAAAVAGHAP
jgi:hypothetical protein